MFPQTAGPIWRPSGAGQALAGKEARDLIAGLTPGSERRATFSELLPYWHAYATYEWRFSPQSIYSYSHDLRQILRIIGDMPAEEISAAHVLFLKAQASVAGCGPARIRRLVAALKSFLRFCSLAMGLQVLDPKQLRGPAVPRREVVYLTPDEVGRFVSAIPVYKNQRAFDMKWLSFRALVEVLLGTGMRISEALSLKRSAIRFDTGEAQIIGKGSKERTVFFSSRALAWVKEYVNRRTDTRSELFLATNRKPLGIRVVSKRFRMVRALTGLEKNVTPHILRHTVATTLLFNGCPIGHIKQILGHAMLETTCKFYLGVDNRAAKQAHRAYLTYNHPQEARPADGAWDPHQEMGVGEKQGF